MMVEAKNAERIKRNFIEHSDRINYKYFSKWLKSEMPFDVTTRQRALPFPPFHHHNK